MHILVKVKIYSISDRNGTKCVERLHDDKHVLWIFGYFHKIAHLRAANHVSFRFIECLRFPIPSDALYSDEIVWKHGFGDLSTFSHYRRLFRAPQTWLGWILLSRVPNETNVTRDVRISSIEIEDWVFHITTLIKRSSHVPFCEIFSYLPVTNQMNAFIWQSIVN